LEYLPIVLAVSTWNVLHPGYLAPKDDANYPAGSHTGNSTAPILAHAANV